MSKHRLNITIDEALYQAVLKDRNISGYINQLVRDDYLRTHSRQFVKHLTEQVRKALLQDEALLTELQHRLDSGAKTVPEYHYT